MVPSSSSLFGIVQVLVNKAYTFINSAAESNTIHPRAVIVGVYIPITEDKE